MRTFLLFALLHVSAVGFPCSVKRIPPPEELVADADAIYVGKIGKSAKKEMVEVEVVDVIKGATPKKGDKLEIHGQTDQYDGPNDEKPPYKFVRPGGRHGNCFAGDYKLGGFFLFISRKGSVHRALAPTNEEVTGLDDPWVKWVRAHVKTK